MSRLKSFDINDLFDQEKERDIAKCHTLRLKYVDGTI